MEYRTPHPGEAFEFFTPVLRSFGEPPDQPAIDHHRTTWEPERSYGALEDGKWVGSSGAYSLRMTVPWATDIPVSGITMVGVATTHRRRGVLTRMMSWLLDDAERRGEAVAMLTASESSIYGRFGFGVAAQAASHEIDLAGAAFRVPLDIGGRFSLLSPSEALDVLHPVWDRCRLARVGEMSRPKSRWEEELRDLPASRAGSSALFIAVHEGGGGPDGFVTYRHKNIWGIDTHRLPGNQVVVEALCGATPEVEAALWQFLTQIDLVKTLVLPVRPVDDPIRWRLAEPRQLKVTSAGDWLWARLLDIPAALSARRYRTRGELVLEVSDPLRPNCAGTFHLEGGPDGAACRRVSSNTPDLTLGAAELGSLYLGGVAPSALAMAGRIDEHTPGALAKADALLQIDPRPFCNTMF